VHRRIEAHQVQITTGRIYFVLRWPAEENGRAGYHHLDTDRIRPFAAPDFGARAGLPAILGEEVRSREQGTEVLVRAWALPDIAWRQSGDPQEERSNGKARPSIWTQ
jgi:hypothetical protein